MMIDSTMTVSFFLQQAGLMADRAAKAVSQVKGHR
jgi:hypothetical protein